MKTIEQCWASYRCILPADAGSIQITETKRAFLSGMMEMDSQMHELAKLSDEEAMNGLTVIRQQLAVAAAVYLAAANSGSVREN